MKPRNKLERSIVAMADSLPPLTEQQRDFAKGLFPAEALYYSRRGNNCEFYCQCCGAMVPTIGKWIMEEHDTDTWTCPVCGAQCKVLPQYSGGWNHNYDRRTGAFSQSPTTARYVTLADTHEGYQVFRTFEVYRWNGRSDTGGVHRGCPTEFYFWEIYQNWIDEKGQETIVSRPYTRGFTTTPGAIGVPGESVDITPTAADIISSTMSSPLTGIGGSPAHASHNASEGTDSPAGSSGKRKRRRIWRSSRYASSPTTASRSW